MKPGRERTVSIRWSLFKSFLVLVVLISGSLLAYSVGGAGRAIRDLTESLFTQVSLATEDELVTFFAPISKSVEIVADLAERSVFSPDDPEKAARVLIPVLMANPQMSSINTGDETGNALLIVRREDEWLVISIWGGRRFADWRKVDAGGQTLKRWRQQTDFDPRTRPWYALAMQGGEGDRIRWTAPYGFVPTGDPGITASVRVEGSGGGYVLAFDVLLEDLAAFAQNIVVPGNGTTFVLSDDGRLIVPPSGTTREVRDLLLQRPEDVGMPLVTEGIRQWRERQTPEPFKFEFKGEPWWGVFNPQVGAETRKFWIAVLIPERHLAGERRRDRYALLLVTVLALAVATLMALLLSRSYSRPLQELVKHSSRLESLHTDEEVAIESSLTEVRQLADAQEKMRRALDAFARYVPVGVVRELLERGEAAKVGEGRDTEVTVLFTDIVGFTTMAESMTASELTRHMSFYFDGVVEILHRHGATVDKFIGDSVMAFWGAPKPLSNHSRPAVEAVLGIREWLAESNLQWRREGLPELPTRFGLASGVVTVGNVGARRRLSYTVLGDPVNLARRLEELNSELGTTVLVSEDVRKKAGDVYSWRDVETVTVKGKTVSVQVFELLGRLEATV